MIDHESPNIEAAARLARDADAWPGDDRPTRAEADHEAWLDEHTCHDRCPCDENAADLFGHGVGW